MNLSFSGVSFRRASRCAALLLVVFLLHGWAAAQTSKLTVHFDPATTEIRWKLSGDLHTTHGTFRLKGGVVILDSATGVAEGELLVDLASGESGDKKRDSKMQAEVLQSDKYPEAFFHPTKVTGAVKTGTTQTVSVEGTFNIHGADHPLTIQVEVKLDGSQATATSHFNIPYVAWGMKDPSSGLLRVGKVVGVDVVAHGAVEPVAAAQ